MHLGQRWDTEMVSGAELHLSIDTRSFQLQQKDVQGKKQGTYNFLLALGNVQLPSLRLIILLKRENTYFNRHF